MITKKDMNEEFPKTYFLDLDGHEHLVGRLIVTPIEKTFMVEIDVVFKEGQKILRHIDILYGVSEVQEAVDLGVQHLTQSFLS